jgi:glycosyltransferase involved in cell wall biosynthesis
VSSPPAGRAAPRALAKKERVGILNLNMAAMGGGEKRTLVMAEHLRQRADVFFITSIEPDLAALEKYFDVRLDGVRAVILEPESARSDGDGLERTIGELGLDLLINNSLGSSLSNPAPHGIYMCMFPHRPAALPSEPPRAAPPDSARRRRRHVSGARFLDTYGRITANSRFTRRWIWRRWGRRADLVYSVCDPAGPVEQKDPLILHVGRFMSEVAGGHHKRQDILLEAFRGLSSLHASGWRLAFAGHLDPGPEASVFLERLRIAARGLPVDFHVGSNLDALRDLYRRAAIYWHATGFGSSERRFPERQEHFGITTVEAMSAGAVPIVMDSGGQRETVAHGVNGFRWSRLEDLAEWTLRVAQKPPLRRRLGMNALESAGRFSRPKFRARLDRILARV